MLLPAPTGVSLTTTDRTVLRQRLVVVGEPTAFPNEHAFVSVERPAGLHALRRQPSSLLLFRAATMRATVLATVLLIALRLAATCRLIQSGRQRRATLLILVTTAVLVRTSTQISPDARQSRLHRLLRLPFGFAAHWTPGASG
jgi:hypothetical protein